METRGTFYQNKPMHMKPRLFSGEHEVIRTLKNVGYNKMERSSVLFLSRDFEYPAYSFTKQGRNLLFRSWKINTLKYFRLIYK
jgi:hypothetical protein